jgi:hypothetical protein
LLSAHHHHQNFAASTTGIHWGASLTDSSWSDGQGPILQAYPFCESSTPEKKKKKNKFKSKRLYFIDYQPIDK